MNNTVEHANEKVIFLHGVSQYEDESITLDLVEIDLDADTELHDSSLPRMKVTFDVKNNVVDFIDAEFNNFFQLKPLHFNELGLINYPENHAFVIDTNGLSIIFMYGDDSARVLIKDFMLKNKIAFKEEKNLI